MVEDSWQVYSHQDEVFNKQDEMCVSKGSVQFCISTQNASAWGNFSSLSLNNVADKWIKAPLTQHFKLKLRFESSQRCCWERLSNGTNAENKTSHVGPPAGAVGCFCNETARTCADSYTLKTPTMLSALLRTDRGRSRISIRGDSTLKVPGPRRKGTCKTQQRLCTFPWKCRVNRSGESKEDLRADIRQGN